MPSLNTGNAILSNAIAVDSSYNVGIGGAASGSFKLQVTGTSNLTGALTGTSATFSSLTLNSGNAVLNTYFQTGTSAGWDVNTFFTGGNTGAEVSLNLGYAGATTDTFIKRGSNGRLDLGTGATARLTIASNGSISNSNAAASNYAFQILGNSGTGVSYGSVIQAGTNSSDVSLDVRNYSGTTLLRVRGDGNVGIGTDSPSARLHVANSAGGAVGFFQSTATNGEAQISIQGRNSSAVVREAIFKYDNADVFRLATASNIGLRFETNDVVRMLITAGGTIQYFSGATLYGEIFIAGTAMAINGYNGDLNLQTSGANRLKINSSGNIGIDRTATANRLEVNGDASKTTAGSWLANSDINIKTDINTIDGALDRINKVRLVSFKYKDAYKEANNGIKDKYYHNVIAQEFQEIYPDYVYDSGDIFEENNVLQVDTNPMYVDSVSAIQELSKMIQEQQAQIEELKQIVATK
jgi:hypothetical protein